MGLEAAGSKDAEPRHLDPEVQRGLGRPSGTDSLPSARETANDPGQRRLHQKSTDELSFGNLFPFPLNWKPLTFF